MATFTVGSPITTTDSQVEVTIDPTNPLPIGVHKFQLVVVDQAGNSSQPTVVEILVKDMEAPTAVLDAPPQVDFGKSFTLSGARSTDNGPDKVVTYVWSLVDPATGGGAPVIPNPVVTPLPIRTPILNPVLAPAGGQPQPIEQPGGGPAPIVTPPGQ